MTARSAQGIGLFGLIAAALSSFFVEQQHKGQFDLLLDWLASLEAKLDSHNTAQAAAVPEGESAEGGSEG